MTDRGAELVADFLECWHRRDLDALAARIAEDVLFSPDPTSVPVRGRDAVVALWRTYLETITGYDATIRSQLASEGRVFVERVERLKLAGDRMMVLPIVGVFEVDDDGLITAWRDYWDTAAAKPP